VTGGTASPMKKRHHRRKTGQGALAGVLPFFCASAYADRYIGLRADHDRRSDIFCFLLPALPADADRLPSRRKHRTRLHGVLLDTPVFPLPFGRYGDTRLSAISVVASVSACLIIPRAKYVRPVAANQSFDSSRRMSDAANGGSSKLCMVRPCHATSNFLSEIVAAQLGKRRASGPPRCIPSLVPAARVEILPPFRCPPLQAATARHAGFRAFRLTRRSRVVMGGAPVTASRPKLAFVRRRSKERRYTIRVPFTDEELAIVEAGAADCGLSVEDYLIMRALLCGKADGNA
jgi:hypothetical protein